jgi:dihydroneopterin aldolase
VNAAWTLKVERMEIHLPVGIHPDEVDPQPLWVSLTATGMADASPRSIEQCIDYEPLCHWLSSEWPRTPHTPLLETRINQLIAFVFDLDTRVQTVWAGLYKQRMSRDAVAVGIERQATRLEFEEQQRGAASDPAMRISAQTNHATQSHAVIHH